MKENKENIEKDIKKIESDAEVNLFKYLGYILGFGVAMVNIPASLLIVISGELLSSIEKESNLNEVKMSDDWLEQVSNTKNLSQKGLLFLAKKLSQQGYVTGKDAKKWLEIEEKETQKKIIKEKIDHSKNNRGVALLLKRAKKWGFKKIDKR